jgi:hypothetical protein
MHARTFFGEPKSALNQRRRKNARTFFGELTQMYVSLLLFVFAAPRPSILGLLFRCGRHGVVVVYK